MKTYAVVETALSDRLVVVYWSDPNHEEEVSGDVTVSLKTPLAMFAYCNLARVPFVENFEGTRVLEIPYE